MYVNNRTGNCSQLKRINIDCTVPKPLSTFLNLNEMRSDLDFKYFTHSAIEREERIIILIDND